MSREFRELRGEFINRNYDLPDEDSIHISGHNRDRLDDSHDASNE